MSEIERYAGLDGREYVPAPDHDAKVAELEAEIGHLKHRLEAADEWATIASEQLRGRDQLAAELAALKGAAGDAAPSGYDALWNWFGLSRAAWLTLPRVLMHSMPDEWQRKMAALLAEWDGTWSTGHLPAPEVRARVNGRLSTWPKWVLSYRHPDRDAIAAHRAGNGDAPPL